MASMTSTIATTITGGIGGSLRSVVSHTSGNTGVVLTADGLEYLGGFGNSFESECLPGALPRGRSNPRTVPYNLYTEQLSGTAFTAPRHQNRRTWLYRIQPSVSGTGVVNPVKSPYTKYFGGVDPKDCQPSLNPLRWKPLTDEVSQAPQMDFCSGMRLMCSAGDPSLKNGLAMYMYTAQVSMQTLRTNMANNDGEFLIVPQQGTLEILTELGRMTLCPTEVAVIPRGIVFQVNLLNHTPTSPSARGYVLEVYNPAGFQLPERGPIGSNGLANARDFLHPVAWCVDSASHRRQCRILTKTSSRLFQTLSDHSPYNVVAWHGNYLPYKYDLELFCAVGSVSYDHLDPSIYTVLTCPTDHPGTAMADFVIFPPRVMATDNNTLRPPWFHRNTMSEYMGIIQGKYDAKEEFVPGGASLHNCMVPHGPDMGSYVKGINDDCEEPAKCDGGLAFMFETCLQLGVSPNALEDENWRDFLYADCWRGLVDRFSAWGALDRAMNKAS